MSNPKLLIPVLRTTITQTQIRLDEAKYSLERAIADEQHFLNDLHYALARQTSRKQDVAKLEEELAELNRMLKESGG